jgi:REP element-mobilizing transposase RayT
MVLSDYGQIAMNCWLEIPEHFENIIMDEFTIMPEHIHGIIVIKNEFAVSVAVGARHAVPRQQQKQQRQEQFGKPTVGSIPTIIRSYKSAVTNKINLIRELNKPPVWQKNYYEHIIRNELVLKKVRRYIINNPAKYGKS